MKKYETHTVSQRAQRLRTSGLVNELECLIPNLLIFQTFTILAKGTRGIESNSIAVLLVGHPLKILAAKKNRKLIHLSKCANIHQKLTCALADCAWNMSFFLRWHLLLFVLGSESVPLEKTQRKTAVLHVRIYCGLPWLIGVQDLHRISIRVQGISLETLNMETEVPFSFAMTQTFSWMIPSHKS